MYSAHSQKGAVLLIILLIALLSATTLLLSEFNQNTLIQIENQKQTGQVLGQAKEALVGFAMTYAQTHPGHLAGYLPCPDMNGDGDADAPCSRKGYSIIGRFPWKTLGLPPLRDGSGECLWYAVSGNFKDNPKSKLVNFATDKVKTLTSDDGGLLVVKNIVNTPITGIDSGTRAIAVIFAPGTSIEGQVRQDNGSSGNQTECGSLEVVSGGNLNPINDVKNYLDRLIYKGSSSTVDINNPTGDGKLTFVFSASGNSGFYAADNDPDNLSTLPVFVSAPVSRDPDSPQKITFNDALAIITPEDFYPVYKMMDLEVAKRVTRCIYNYGGSAGSRFYYDFLERRFKGAITGGATATVEFPDPDTYRNTYQTEIDNYVDIRVNNCLVNCPTTSQVKNCIADCQTDTVCTNKCLQDCKDACQTASRKLAFRRLAIGLTLQYPWVGKLTKDNVSQKGISSDQKDNRFGRVPDYSKLTDTSGSNALLAQNWFEDSNGKNCFEETNGDAAYEWYWWDEWKELVFYVLDDNLTPDEHFYFWVNTERILNTNSSLSESTASFNARAAQLKTATLSKIKESADTTNPNNVTATDWEHVSASTSTGANSLKLKERDNSENSANFLVIVAGRKLASFPLPPKDSQKRAARNVQIQETYSGEYEDIVNNLENYLEGENIPTVGTTNNPVDKIPPGDEIFKRNEVSNYTNSVFNDSICRNSVNDCKVP